MKIPHIHHAFENIKSKCDKALSEHYPVKTPKDIISRYHQELGNLKESEFLDDFEIFRLLSEESMKCSTFITMRGTVTGSFLYYLLGNTGFNPLPVHYYCPKCGYYKTVDTHLFGIDLPEKECPCCKKNILADGYNLQPESVWGNDGKKQISFEYNVSSEFYPFARRVFHSIYPDNCIVPWGMFRFNPELHYSDNQEIGVDFSGYAILPIGTTIEDYPDLISYLENGDSCVTGGEWELKNCCLKPVYLFSHPHIDYLVNLQRATGIYVHEISNRELREITWSSIFHTTMLDPATNSFFHQLRPKTYHDMVSMYSSAHSTFSWQENEHIDLYIYNNMVSSDAFKKYPCFTREDFFDYLLKDGFERDYSFEVSEKIRKGYAYSEKFKEAFGQLPISDEMKEVATNYRYVFPRAHCIAYMLIYARLAYYAKADRRTFSRIVCKNKPKS